MITIDTIENGFLVIYHKADMPSLEDGKTTLYCKDVAALCKAVKEILA